jgi:hypothetical protein
VYLRIKASSPWTFNQASAYISIVEAIPLIVINEFAAQGKGFSRGKFRVERKIEISDWNELSAKWNDTCSVIVLSLLFGFWLFRGAKVVMIPSEPFHQVFLRICAAENSLCLVNQFPPAVDSKFGEQRGNVKLYGTHGDSQSISDFLVHAIPKEFFQHLSFARAQRYGPAKASADIQEFLRLLRDLVD